MTLFFVVKNKVDCLSVITLNVSKVSKKKRKKKKEREELKEEEVC